MEGTITRSGLLGRAGVGALGRVTAGPAAEGNAACLHVSPAGDDGNDGRSWARAKRQISSAVASLGRTDGVIWVAPGTYSPFSLIGPYNRVSVIGLGDVRVMPTGTEVGILIDTSAGTPRVGPVVENSLIAGNQIGGT